MESVNHPSHYTSHPSGIECIRITEHYDFNIGNAIKYLWRCGLKHDTGLSDEDKQVEDLNKAIWYIENEIGNIVTGGWQVLPKAWAHIHDRFDRNSALAELAELEGREIYQRPKDELKAVCNGCGPERWDEAKRMKLDRWLWLFAPSFDIHDCDFDCNDGSIEGWKEANRRCVRNNRRLIRQRYPLFSFSFLHNLIRRIKWTYLNRLVALALFSPSGLLAYRQASRGGEQDVR